jgi:PAS domain S-box-containing protein
MADLRERAETAVLTTRTAIDRMSPDEVQRLVHELQVHQIELEMQNEELRHAQVALTQSRDRFNQLYDFAPVGYMTLSAEGRVLEANLALASLLGLVRGKLMGQKFSSFVPPESQDPLYLHQRAVQDSGAKQVCQLDLRRSDGATFPARMETIALRNEEGGGFHFLSVIIDMTDIKRAQAQVQQLNADLERRVSERTQALRESEVREKQARQTAETANLAKSEFLTTMSHEMRTPLNGILGLTELLLLDHLPPQQRQYVTLIGVNGETLLTLIEDLLDIGKIEAGQLDTVQVPFSLDELLRELGDLYTLLARDKGLTFSAHHAPRVPVVVIGDRHRLRQILNNLLANALKFTHHGEISLSVEFLRSERLNDQHISTLRFTVRDSGIGIAPEVQNRLFTRFVQADSGTTQNYGGTGLGLAIVKQLAEHLGGGVALSSVPGQGSVFSCDIPFNEVAPLSTSLAVTATASQGELQAESNQARILVAEDNPINQLVVLELAKRIGYHDITVVDNGQEAVEAVQNAHFDLILMDCRMPVLDGYAAAEKIRALGVLTPIIAVTANASVADQEKCRSLGMNDYLTKPINLTHLRETLARWVQPH